MYIFIVTLSHHTPSEFCFGLEVNRKNQTTTTTNKKQQQQQKYHKPTETSNWK